MVDAQFVIADEEGKPEGITDPLTLMEDESSGKPTTDPKPKAAPRTVRPVKQDPAPRKPGRPSKSDLETEVQKEIQAMIMLGSAIWGQYDEECPVILSKQSKDISSALAAILAKHPALLMRMRDMTGMGDYLALAVAIMPVVQAISKHHVQPGLAKRPDEQNGFENAGA
jgi:hypothetical protein